MALNGKPYIYLLTDTRNGKQYVGQSNGNNSKYFSSGILVNRIIKKYDKNIFKKDILVSGDFCKALLNDLEIHYIQLYNTYNDGYNLTPGGECFSEKARNRQKVKRGKIEYTPALRKKMRKAAYKRKNFKKQLDAARNKFIENVSVKLYQYSKDGQLINTFPSIIEAVRNFKPNATKGTNISNILDKENRTAFGYIWKSKKL